MLPPSPFAPATFPTLLDITGVRLATAQAGVKYQGRTDLMLVELALGTQVAGTLTQSKTRAAPVEWCAKVLQGGTARAILVNSGNANAFTGLAGMRDAEYMAQAAAEVVGCKSNEVLVASTGVIGEKLPSDRIAAALPSLKTELDSDNWEATARAIMTTDTFPKGAAAETEIDGVPVKITGIAKGSGMIAPDMATMLGFVFTDAALPASILRPMLSEAVNLSFNCITVDGDTSTSDTVLMAATGAAGNKAPANANVPALANFRTALHQVCINLAQQIVKDGEGAQKFITIDVTGAENDEAARRIGLCIGNSLLVKTAIAGEDANWGRIVMAVGKAGEQADRDRLSIAIGGVTIVKQGEGVEEYDEAPVAKHLKGREIHIAVDVGVRRTNGTPAPGHARIWTCDLTHGYISINADYRS